jgi:hypothetical protein
MLKVIFDLAHYVDWSGNQQATLTEPIFLKQQKPIFWLYNLIRK